MSLKGLIVGFLCAVSMVGCGGSSDGGSGSSAQTKGNTSAVEVKTGYFVDAPVMGLRYRTNSRSGITDELGRFDYLPGERVVFSIGGTVLGSAEAGDIMTPGSLDDTGQWDGPQAINIARLLITLDADQNPLNGIEITAEMHTVFRDLEFDLSQASERLGASNALQRAMQEAGRVGLVSVAAARQHLAYVAQRLPEEPTEADIINLIDTGPNYSGRQTPMTATPDNLRKAAQVFWADPDNPAPDLHWLVRAFDPDMLRTMIERDLAGEAQPNGVRLFGDIAVDDNGQFKSADLLFSLDGYSTEDWVYNGSVYAQVSPDFGYTLQYGSTGSEEQASVDIDAYIYDLFFENLRVSLKPKEFGDEGVAKRESVTLGIHGWHSVVRALDNPYEAMRSSLMNLTLRKLHSEQSVRLVANAPFLYLKNEEELSKHFGAYATLTGSVNVMSSALGAYTIEGWVDTDVSSGQVRDAGFDFLRADGLKFGEVRAINLPNTVTVAERVRAEVLPTLDNPSGEFDVFLLETPLTGQEDVTDAAPIWLFDFIRYEIVGKQADPTTPVGVVLKLPPFSLDPDGDPIIDWQNYWQVNGKEIPTGYDEGGNAQISLNLQLGLQSTATTVCIRNRTTYEDTVMDIALGIDLTRETGVEHTVNFEDAVCDSL